MKYSNHLIHTKFMNMHRQTKKLYNTEQYTHIFEEKQRSLVILQCKIDHATIVVVKEKLFCIKLSTLQYSQQQRQAMQNIRISYIHESFHYSSRKV